MVGLEPADSSSDLPEGSRRNAGSAFAAQITSAAFSAVLTLFLVRALTPAGYGLLGLAGAIGGILLLPSDFGVSQSAARYIAERRNDRLAVARVIASALRIKLVFTGTVSLALFSAAGLIASAYGQPGLTWVLRGLAIAMLAESFMLLLTYAFAAQGRTSLNISIVLMEGSVEMTASIALVLLGAGATGAAFGRAIGYIAGFSWALILVIQLVGRAVVARPPPGASMSRPIVRYGGALLVVDSAYTLFNAIDVLVIGQVLAVSAVGLFSAPMRLIALLQLPSVAVSTAVSPRMAAGFAAQRQDQTFVRGLSYVAVFQVALVPPLLVWAEPIVHVVLGANYGGSVDVLRALTPFAFLLGFGSLFSVTANYLGLARQRVPIAITTVIINIVVDLILIPRIGIVGGAIGTDLAYAVYVPANFLICRSVLDVPLRQVVITFLRASAAAVAMAGILLAFGTQGLSLPQIVLGAALAVTVYVAVLIATARLSRVAHGSLLGI